MRALIVLSLVVLTTSCLPKADPEKGRYSCSVPADCGLGYDCRAQADGTSLCFKTGTCAAIELCNGIDDDCDGLIDETFPESETACTTTVPGRCSVGIDACEAGAIVCRQSVMPAVEICNGLDDNCDGRTDETFDRTSDSLNCGACGRACTPGTTCRNSDCHETTCNDQLDNDLDRKFDCDDEDCLMLQCSVTQVPAWSCAWVLQVDGGLDAGVADAGTDAGVTDAGDVDAGFVDAGDFDAGEVDAGLVDAGDPDAGDPDAGPVDAGDPDAGAGPLPGPSPLPPPLDAGVYKLGCYPPESACGNGFDDDGDGLTDCADVDCTGAVCSAGKVCQNRLCVTP